jgi:hypothetical protein
MLAMQPALAMGWQYNSECFEAKPHAQSAWLVQVKL